MEIPELSEQLAEYLGIHFGDGHVQMCPRHGSRITITLNRCADWQYVYHIQELFESQFGITLRKRTILQKNCVSLWAYSKELCSYLNSVHGVPAGKKDPMRIPRWILSDSRYLFAFARGVLDTDGCTFIRNTNGYDYPTVKISNKNFMVLMQLSVALNQHGSEHILIKSERIFRYFT